MLGVSDKSWLIEMLSNVSSGNGHVMRRPDDPGQQYLAYFGLGHHIKLYDQPGVFKVSLAGMALGSCLLKCIDHHELRKKFLDVGTGSGALALLLRSMGAHDVTGTDVSEISVDLARENELLNFEKEQIGFYSGNLFSGLPANELYDTVVFNPPGWRTPSDKLLEELRRIGDECDMAPEAMFYGDQVLLRFLQDLPSRLNQRGRALVGLNSLVGIQDVLSKYRAEYPDGEPLKFRLIERHTLPVLFYSLGWQRAEPFLRQEFKYWQDRCGAAYTVDSHNRLYWSYEVVECTRTPIPN